MAFITEKEELKPGLILFRRGNVDHRMWYCRMKMPKADRYKTVSLKTTDISAARERAFDQDADVRFRIKHDVPVFNRPFRDVAREYLLTQEARAKSGEISAARPKKLRAVIEGTLDRYAGSTQVHLIGDERWGGYPAWRRENGAGRHRRNGVREVTADAAQSFADHEAERRTKVQQTLGIRVLKPIEVKPSAERVVLRCHRGNRSGAAEGVAQRGAVREQEIVCDGDCDQTACHGFGNLRLGAVARLHQAGKQSCSGSLPLRKEARQTTGVHRA